jgi:hypothetical protein
VLTKCLFFTGQYQHPAPHATIGAVGRDGTVGGSKIDPLAAKLKSNTSTDTHQGLDDEAIDTARIAPMGEVREEFS